MKPVRVRLEHDAVLDRNRWTLHRPDCRLAPADAEPVPDGELVVGSTAPRACMTCWPSSVLLLSA